jgi:hypothetical protein
MGQFLVLLTSLNSAGPDMVALGFVQCAFAVVNGNTLELTITHPLDVGPDLRDPSVPSGGALVNPPTLSASEVQVKPGGTLTAAGTNFPIASVSQIPITWGNTSSGKAVGAQLKYGVAGQPAGGPIDLALSALSDGIYSYTAKSLAAGTTYSFSARCGDELTWSKWSNPLQITTAKTTLVNLVLKPVGDPNSPGVTVGSAALSQTSTNWNATAVIPPTTADGSYDLVAELSGVAIALTPITVSSVLKPILFMIDPSNHDAVVTSPVLMGGSPFTMKGEDFPPGVVSVTLNDTVVGTPSAPTGEFVLALNVPGNATSGGQNVTVTATSGSASATYSFQSLGPPQ